MATVVELVGAVDEVRDNAVAVVEERENGVAEHVYGTEAELWVEGLEPWQLGVGEHRRWPELRWSRWRFCGLSDEREARGKKKAGAAGVQRVVAR